MSHEVAGAANAFFVKTSAQLIALCGNRREQFDPIGTAWDKPTTCFRLRTYKARTNSIANRCTLLWFMRNSAPRLTAFSNRVSTIKPRAPVLLGICPGHLLARLASCGRHRARTFCCRPGRPSWKAPAKVRALVSWTRRRLGGSCRRWPEHPTNPYALSIEGY